MSSLLFEFIKLFDFIRLIRLIKSKNLNFVLDNFESKIYLEFFAFYVIIEPSSLLI